MGFFRRRKSKKPKYLNEDLSKFIVKYKSLDEIINKEIEVGSLDIKRTVINENIGELYFQDNKILGVILYNSNFKLTNRMYWEDYPNKEKLLEKLEEISVNVNDSVDIIAYNNYITEFPEHSEEIKDYYRKAHLANALAIDEMIKKIGEVTVKTEIVLSKKKSDVVKTWDFLNLEIDDFLKTVSLEENKVSRFKKTLGIPDEGSEDVKITLVDKSFEPQLPVEKFIVSGALNNASLTDFQKLTFGFTPSVVLKHIEALELDDVIELENTLNNSYDESGLPDISNIENIKENFEPFEIDNDTEWAFDETTSNDDKKQKFTPTPHLNEDIEELIIIIKSKHTLSGEIINKIDDNLKNILILEDEISEIEQELEPLSNKYDSGVKKYDEMKFDKELESIQTIESDADEASSEGGQYSEEPEMKNQRIDSNKNFFILEKLEELRYDKNELRKKFLYGLLSAIPYDNSDNFLLKANEIIEDKITGIDLVTNVAFHPKNPLVHKVQTPKTLNLIENAVREGEYTFSILDNIRPNNLPSNYDDLVKKFGFDPILEYKERVRAEQGIPFASLSEDEITNISNTITTEKNNDNYKRTLEEESNILLSMNDNDMELFSNK